MKRLILCCDGTWNRADQQRNEIPCPTNVVKLAHRLGKRGDDGVLQIIYYAHGVGTGNSLDRLSGGAFGSGLEENIHDAYRFLIANFEPGDQLYLFGFSRGAFTVRSLAGMVRKCGILQRGAVEHYRRALALYRSGHHPDENVAAEFRARHCVTGEQGVKIRMIGVWDTVGALGIPMRGLRWITRGRHRFHDTELSGAVEHGYHALAVDERRGPFEPTLWFYKPKPGQHVEQVWFAGAHSDVGGGYEATGLSDIALEWMIAKARAVGLGFLAAGTGPAELRSDPHGTIHDSRTGAYRLVPPAHREIGARVRHRGGSTADESDDAAPTDPTQSLHPAVLARWDADARYRPRSLRRYFERIGDLRARR